MNNINLGDKVKDEVSGFTGIAIGRTQWLQGCDRVVIQPVVGKDGKLPDSATFDEPQLILITPAKVKKVKSDKTGGYDISIFPKNNHGR